MNVYMNGTMTPKIGRKTKQHGEGRVCSNKDCEQVLSKYNENKQCFLHAPKNNLVSEVVKTHEQKNNLFSVCIYLHIC